MNNKESSTIDSFVVHLRHLAHQIKIKTDQRYLNLKIYQRCDRLSLIYFCLLLGLCLRCTQTTLMLVANI